MPLEEVTPAVARLLTHSKPELRLAALKTLSNLLLDTEHVKVSFCHNIITQCLFGVLGESDVSGKCTRCYFQHCHLWCMVACHCLVQSIRTVQPPLPVLFAHNQQRCLDSATFQAGFVHMK